jgi:ribonuclease T2
MTTLEPSCYSTRSNKYQGVVDYFDRAVSQFKKLPTYDWLKAAGIVPSLTATYTLEQLQAVAIKRHGFPITWGCSSAGVLDEAWYHYLTKGPIA